jgi:outer membrane murein-binding lipoprotein Lpp
MYNTQYEQRVQELDLHQIISSILISICESNLKKDRIKEHIIRLFGGISRTVLDSMQEEIKYINDKMEDIKVEKSKINAKLDKKSEDLEKLQEDYKNLL